MKQNFRSDNSIRKINQFIPTWNIEDSLNATSHPVHYLLFIRVLSANSSIHYYSALKAGLGRNQSPVM